MCVYIYICIYLYNLFTYTYIPRARHRRSLFKKRPHALRGASLLLCVIIWHVVLCITLYYVLSIHMACCYIILYYVLYYVLCTGSTNNNIASRETEVFWASAVHSQNTAHKPQLSIHTLSLLWHLPFQPSL